VFENDLVELDVAGSLAAAEGNEHTLITSEVRRLQIAAHWADLHPGEAVTESRLPGTEHPVRLGGDGTPTVGGFAAAELGCVLRMSDGSAARMIGMRWICGIGCRWCGRQPELGRCRPTRPA
jgi:hypothetical protein